MTEDFDWWAKAAAIWHFIWFFFPFRCFWMVTGNETCCFQYNPEGYNGKQNIHQDQKNHKPQIIQIISSGNKFLRGIISRTRGRVMLKVCNVGYSGWNHVFFIIASNIFAVQVIKNCSASLHNGLNLLFFKKVQANYFPRWHCNPYGYFGEWRGS